MLGSQSHGVTPFTEALLSRSLLLGCDLSRKRQKASLMD